MEMKYTCVLVHVNCISLGRWTDAMDMKNQFVNNLYNIRIIGFNIKLHIYLCGFNYGLHISFESVHYGNGPMANHYFVQEISRNAFLQCLLKRIVSRGTVDCMRTFSPNYAIKN
jgi:hypothetical protein